MLYLFLFLLKPTKYVVQIHNSFLYCVGRKNLNVFTGRSKKRSKKTYVRTIVCIPHQFVKVERKFISIPRGKKRAELHALNLCAKMEISVSYSENAVRQEISDLFLNCFIPISNCNIFQFDFLTTIPRLKLLQRAKVNSGFKWDGMAVQSLSKGILHILSHSQHFLKTNVAVTHSTDDGALVSEVSLHNVAVTHSTDEALISEVSLHNVAVTHSTDDEALVSEVSFMLTSLGWLIVKRYFMNLPYFDSLPSLSI